MVVHDVVTQLLAALADDWLHDCTPVGPLLLLPQVVTTFVDAFVPALQDCTGVLELVVVQVVVVKLASVPCTQADAGAIGVAGVEFAEQVTWAQPLPALGLAGVQLAAAVGPTTRGAQVVLTKLLP